MVTALTSLSVCLSVCVCVYRDGEPVDMADFVQMYNEDSCESVRYGPISPPPPSFPVNMYTYLCSVCVSCFTRIWLVTFQLQSSPSE